MKKNEVKNEAPFARIFNVLILINKKSIFREKRVSLYKRTGGEKEHNCTQNFYTLWPYEYANDSSN